MKRLIFAFILALLIISQVIPAYAVTGSVSLANIRLSLVSTAPFVDFSSAGTLTPYLGGKLTLTDSAGKKAIGYIKAAGTGETYTELLSNGGFDSEEGWTLGAGWSIGSGVATAGDPGNGNLTQSVNLTVGWCLKESFDLISNTAGMPHFYNNGVSPAFMATTTTLDTKTRYITVTWGGSQLIGLAADPATYNWGIYIKRNSNTSDFFIHSIEFVPAP